MSNQSLREASQRVIARLQKEASRRNSAYDHYGMGNTPETVDADAYALASAVLAQTDDKAQPVAVIEWRDAYGRYLAAVDAYNTRLTAIREREKRFPDEFGRDNPHAEYEAMCDAQRTALALIQPMYDVLAAAVPATPQPPAEQGAELSFQQIEECFPDGASSNGFGALVVSAQWLHDFARAILAADRAVRGGAA